MSLSSIREALQIKLKGIYPVLTTAWEHQKFTAKIRTPYQSAYVLWSDTENPSVGNHMYRQRGIFQVSLYYPLGQGASKIETRADLLRSTFYRGLTMTEDSINVVVAKTPAIRDQPSEEGYAIKIVRVEFFAEIFN